MHRFSEFAEEHQLVGHKTKIESVLGKEIVVTDYRLTSSKYHRDDNSDRCLTLQFELNDTVYVLFSGSSVLIQQIERYKDKIPFITTIQKVDKFYTFT